MMTVGTGIMRVALPIASAPTRSLNRAGLSTQSPTSGSARNSAMASLTCCATGRRVAVSRVAPPAAGCAQVERCTEATAITQTTQHRAVRWLSEQKCAHIMPKHTHIAMSVGAQLMEKEQVRAPSTPVAGPVRKGVNDCRKFNGV